MKLARLTLLASLALAATFLAALSAPLAAAPAPQTAAARAPQTAAKPAPQTFTGVITDDECPKGDHSQMRMGPTDAECVKNCITYHSASYVLYDGRNSYILSDQKTPEQFAGQKVKVTGTLDARRKTIQVESIAAQQ
jgi:hypothetical protein